MSKWLPIAIGLGATAFAIATFMGVRTYNTEVNVSDTFIIGMLWVSMAVDSLMEVIE